MIDKLPDFIAEARTFVEEQGVRLRARMGQEVRFRIYTRAGTEGYYFESSHYLHVPTTGKYASSNTGPFPTLAEARERAIRTTFASLIDKPDSQFRLEPNEDYQLAPCSR